MKKFSFLLILTFMFAFALGATRARAPKVIAAGEQCTKAPSSMVSWWPAEGDAVDIVSGNNGMMQNGATFAGGMVNQAFSLDGVDDAVGDIGSGSSYSFIQNTGVFTIDAWIKLNNPNKLAIQTITENGNASVDKGHFFLFENRLGEQQLRLGLLKGISGNPIIDSRSPNNVITDTNWHHVGVTGDGTNVVFYVDGVPYSGTNAMGAKSLGDSSFLLRIGDDVHPNPIIVEPFGGLIDEVEIFNRALTASEIAAIYNAGSAGKCREVTVCHMPGEPAEKTLTIPIQALDGHLDHGDTIGACPSDGNPGDPGVNPGPPQ